MSREYRDRVWKNKELKGGRLLVMLALADHADPDGECYPGMALLMEKTRLTDRQLRRVLNGLDTDGLISIEERAIGRGKRPHYRLFPQEKADILSDQKEVKADISDNKSGHLAREKADISDTDYSHVRREPLQQPTTKWEKEIVADATPPVPPASVPVKAKPKRSRKPKDPPSSGAPPQSTEWQEFVGAFCWVCHGHKVVKSLTKEQRGALLSEGKLIYDEGGTVDDLRKWYKEVWGRGWQYQKNKSSRPQPSDVRSSIAQLRAETPEGFEVEPVLNGNHVNGTSKVAGSLAALADYEAIKARHVTT